MGFPHRHLECSDEGENGKSTRISHAPSSPHTERIGDDEIPMLMPPSFIYQKTRKLVAS